MLLAMVVTELGTVTEVSPVDLKALLLMDVTESAMLTAVRLLHAWNAPTPMEVTPVGMVIEVRLLQPLKA